jgi:hypothetical protein
MANIIELAQILLKMLMVLAELIAGIKTIVLFMLWIAVVFGLLGFV